MTNPREAKTMQKRKYNMAYWLKKAWIWEIKTEGREKAAAKEAEARYRREYRHNKARSIANA